MFLVAYVDDLLFVGVDAYRRTTHWTDNLIRGRQLSRKGEYTEIMLGD